MQGCSLQHLRRWNVKISFNHGEGIRREKELFLSIWGGEIWKFSSTQVKGKGQRKSSSTAFEEMKNENFLQPGWKEKERGRATLEVFYSIWGVEISKFSSTRVKGNRERKSYSTSFEEVKFENLLQPWWREREKERGILQHLRSWNFKIFLNQGEGKGREEELLFLKAPP